METGKKKKRSGGSSKRSKMAGKRSELTAEEEARRREEVKEKLREKMELERRALKVVERLLEDSVAEDFLVDCAKFITQANYKDAVEERSIARLCGYPICSNKLGKIPIQKYKISTKTNKVYDITERKSYCSNFCYKASKEFELQISPTALWLRHHESPPKIKLMKTGDGGSSGEEVMLSERCLQEEDIEDPLAVPPASCDSSQLSSTASDLCHSDNSDSEQEQDFISSVISQNQGRRVHWGELPKHTGEDKGGVNIESRKVDKEETNDKDFPEHQSVEEVTTKLGLCSLSQTVTPNTSLPDGSSAAQAQTSKQPSLTTSCKDLNPSTEIRPQLDIPRSALKCSNQNSHNIRNQSDLNITQIGMSKRGAAGLRGLLNSQSPPVGPECLGPDIRLKLLECLKTTLKEWSTDETLKFLYGADHSLGSPFADVKEETKEVEEELDEDDLEEEVELESEGVFSDGRPSVEAPDYEALQRETQQMLRIREFYKGTWFMAEDLEKAKQGGNEVTDQNQCKKEPVLPLVDSQAQHILQKRITVEKLTGLLRNIVGPLRLTMNDVTNDLNKLVRTFRFTNTNIIHTSPEWTLIAVVLLHLLVAVSPVVQEALQTPASVEYLDTLMAPLSLQQQDLLDAVQLFKTPAQ